MARHASKARNGQRAPHRRLFAWRGRRAKATLREGSEASLRREWDQRWPW